MKLTLILDTAPAGVLRQPGRRMGEIGGTAKMAPMIRHFDSDEQAVVWARSLARRRGLGQIYLTDNRKTARR